MNDPRDIMPGDRVLVFDSTLFRDDLSTPLTYTMRPATVVRRYGFNIYWGASNYLIREIYSEGYDFWKYPDCLDVLFDHKPERESCGHSTKGVRTI